MCPQNGTDCRPKRVERRWLMAYFLPLDAGVGVHVRTNVHCAVVLSPGAACRSASALLGANFARDGTSLHVLKCSDLCVVVEIFEWGQSLKVSLTTAYVCCLSLCLCLCCLQADCLRRACARAETDEKRPPAYCDCQRLNPHDVPTLQTSPPCSCSCHLRRRRCRRCRRLMLDEREDRGWSSRHTCAAVCRGSTVVFYVISRNRMKSVHTTDTVWVWKCGELSCFVFVAHCPSAEGFLKK